MFRFAFIRWFCYVIAVITVIFIWWPYPDFVNSMMDTGSQIADLVVHAIAQIFNKDELRVEEVLKLHMHFDRTVVFSIIALAYSLGIDWAGKYRHLYRTFFALVIVHLILTFFWLEYGHFTMRWYKAHEEWVRSTARQNGWYRFQTMATLIHLHAQLVFAEVFLFATLIVRFFHYIYLGGRWCFYRFRGRRAPAT